MRNRLMAAILSLLTIIGLAAVPASATTGGVPDGDDHPNVGLILYYKAEGRFRCTATLVSPTVLLTAAHCTAGHKGKTLIDFRSFISNGPTSGYPAATDTTAGYTQAQIEAAGFISGVAHTHPEYSDFTDEDNWNDVGVIVLDAPVADLPLSPIAGLDTLDDYAQPTLAQTLFTAVGYGTEIRKADSGPQKPTAMSYPMLRRVVDMPGQKLTPQILQTNGNINDTRGTGGTCFGDSGGPVLLNGEIVAVTSYGLTSNCRYIGGYQRVDIDVVQDWLAEFGL
ncbi:MAG TPA: trypsin-like serine protease [Nocardioidaceae bacterium]|nr:trypsin-like serine protease [Nocardioidaceae bacterium]